MSDIATPILEWLNMHPELAGLATFLISAGESVAIIGTIVPGSVMMTAIGALVGAGIIPFWSILFWAILGAIVGDGISYWLGYYFKGRLHDIWPFRQHPSLLARGETFFHTHGAKSVFIGRFVGPVRALVPMVAGMLGLKPLRFTIANVLSAILWAPIYMLPGFILGAAATELPSELAARMILMLLLVALFIGLFFWMVKKIFDLVSNEITQFLTWIWSSLKSSRYFHLITTVLKHHDPTKTHGQLILTFYFLLISIFFLYLTYYILLHGSKAVPLNNFVFHLFRSLRTPAADNVMFYITFLGDRYIIVPLFAILFCWFAWSKRWYTAWHILALGVLTAGSVKIIEYVVRSPRPWGVVGNDSVISGYSYPSGHTALAFTAYLGIALLLIKLFKIKNRTFIYYAASLLIGAVAISRLYFGVHWLSDVVGACLLSGALLILITISYTRTKEKNIEPAGFILTIVGTLLLCYSMTAYFTYQSQKNKYTMLNWPSYTVGFDSWWQQKGLYFPLRRINRFGFSVDAFNVQWIGDLDHLKKILLANHWEIPQERDWLNILYRVSSVQSSEHIPIVPPVYLDKPPVLTVIKYIEPDEKLIILRFWRSPFLIKNIKEPLWLGSVELAPSTYSWLFKRKRINRIPSASSYLFAKETKDWDIKEITFKISDPTLPQKIMLIKPKNLTIENKNRS